MTDLQALKTARGCMDAVINDKELRERLQEKFGYPYIDLYLSKVAISVIIRQIESEIERGDYFGYNKAACVTPVLTVGDVREGVKE